VADAHGAAALTGNISETVHTSQPTVELRHSQRSIPTVDSNGRFQRSIPTVELRQRSNCIVRTHQSRKTRTSDVSSPTENGRLQTNSAIINC
jgi:hypothetical protein